MKLTRLLEVFSTCETYVLFFYPGDLRLGQFCDLPIGAYGEIRQCFPFRTNQPDPPNSFRIMATRPICDDPGATDDGGLR